MVAKDIMTTSVVTIQSTTTIHEAIKLMVEIEISGLIVTDAENNIQGVLTERDLLVAYDQMKQMKAPVGDFINKKVISVSENTPIEEVSEMLVSGNIRRVPVLRGKKVVGVISRSDLLKMLLKQEAKKHG